MSNNLFVLEGLWIFLLDQVEDMDMLGVLNKIDLPLVRVLADMELIGIAVHREEFEKLDIKITEKLEEVRDQIYEYAGYEFNINSLSS